VSFVVAVNNFGDTRSGGLAGPMGLFIIVLMAIGTVLLIRNMNKRLRRLPDSFPDPEAARRDAEIARLDAGPRGAGAAPRGAGVDGDGSPVDRPAAEAEVNAVNKVDTPRTDGGGGEHAQ
jgi:hypothetical protein